MIYPGNRFGGFRGHSNYAYVAKTYPEKDLLVSRSEKNYGFKFDTSWLRIYPGKGFDDFWNEFFSKEPSYPRHALLFGSGGRARRFKRRRVGKKYPGKRFGGNHGHSNSARVAKMYPGKGFGRLMVGNNFLIPIFHQPAANISDISRKCNLGNDSVVSLATVILPTLRKCTLEKDLVAS